MHQLLKTVLATVAGIIAAFLLLIAVEGFSAVVHPFPPDFQHTQAEVCEHVAHYPVWVLAVVVPLWGATAFISVWLAAKLGNLISVTLVGTLLLIAVVANVAMLPYPIWFSIASPGAALAATIAAGRRLRTRPSASAAVTTLGSNAPDAGT